MNAVLLELICQNIGGKRLSVQILFAVAERVQNSVRIANYRQFSAKVVKRTGGGFTKLGLGLLLKKAFNEQNRRVFEAQEQSRASFNFNVITILYTQIS